ARHAIDSDIVRLEESPEAVVFLLSNGIVFVVVTASTLQGDPKESGSRVFHGVLQPHVTVEPEPVARQIAGGAKNLWVGGRDLIPSQHFRQHPIVTLVLVEGIDDPVTPMPGVLL